MSLAELHTRGRTIIVSRAGRKRKAGYREPSGKLQRAYVNERAQVAAQPHRLSVPKLHREDDRAETVFGRLMLNGFITPAQYEAGTRYASSAAQCRALLGAPSPHPRALDLERTGGGGSGREKSVDETKAIMDRHDKAFIAAGKSRFDKAGRPCGGQRVQFAVKQHAVWDKLVDPDSLPLLIIGLMNLVEHYGLDKSLQLSQRPK